MQRLIFVLCPDVEILDLAGPVQVFHEANLLLAGGQLAHLSYISSPSGCLTWLHQYF